MCFQEPCTKMPLRTLCTSPVWKFLPFAMSKRNAKSKTSPFIFLHWSINVLLSNSTIVTITLFNQDFSCDLNSDFHSDNNLPPPCLSHYWHKPALTPGGPGPPQPGLSSDGPSSPCSGPGLLIAAQLGPVRPSVVLQTGYAGLINRCYQISLLGLIPVI